MTLQDHVKKLSELASSFEGTLFLNCFYLKLHYPRTEIMYVPREGVMVGPILLTDENHHPLKLQQIKQLDPLLAISLLGSVDSTSK